jgi:hypothetical protein
MAEISKGTNTKQSRLSLSWGAFLFFLYIYRCFFSVLGDLVIMRFTSIGDTESYQSAAIASHLLKFQNDKEAWISAKLGESQASTFVTDWIGSIFHSMFGGNAILINIGFQSISFVGLVYLLLSVPPSSRKVLSLLIMLPSFTLWTSIASKECLISSSVAILAGFLIRQYTTKTPFNLLHLFAGGILYLFKPHYLIAIAFAWCARNLGIFVRQKALLTYIGLLVSLAGLYIFRDQIDALAFKVQWSFEIVEHVRSTRTESFFVDKYDVFYKMPEGFYRAFMGPTIEEVMTSPLHMATFLESLVLFGALLLAVLRRFRDIPVYNFILSMGVMFWIIFPNYPFGVMNSGSAIRYRSGWIVLVFVAILVLNSRELFQLVHRRNKSVDQKV